MSRVAFLTPGIQPGGGPGGYVFGLQKGYEALRAKGPVTHEFVFVGRRSPHRNNASAEGERRGLKKLRKAVSRWLQWLGVKHFFSRYYRDCVAAIRESELVVVQGMQEPHAARFARKLRKALVYMPHSPTIHADEWRMLREAAGLPVDEDEYARQLAQERELFSLASATVFPSREAADEYEKYFAAEMACKPRLYVESGVEVSAPEGQVSGEISNLFLFVGRYVDHKGYDLFCQAAIELLAEGCEARFATVGSGPLAQEIPGVENFGWRNDVFNVIRDAAVVVVPNRVAYYDLLPLECAALAKPLVMSRVGGNISQLSSLPDSVSFDPGDVQSLKAAIYEALGLIRASAAWGTRNRRAYEVFFTPSAFAERWLKAAEQVVQVHSDKRHAECA